MQFTPPSYLRSAHLQTVLASRIARASQLTSAEFEDAARTITLTSRDGVQLQALLNVQELDVQKADRSAPLVILLHGWLGDATSTYVRRCAAELYQQGFSIARLQLRDHGDTAHLNEALFHSARLTEVLDACNEPGQRFTHSNSNTGAIIGFSLGGNFTLRLAGTNQLNPHFKRCIAICPAVNPTTAAVAIDSGWFGYRWYFVRRWQNALTAKATAFPSLYNFAEARSMSTVAALTDYFVEQHTEFANAAEYYGNYRVSAEMLNNTTHQVTILAAADDPVIPVADIRSLAQAASLNYIETRHGGHCGFINNLNGSSPVAAWLAATLQVSET